MYTTIKTLNYRRYYILRFLDLFFISIGLAMDAFAVSLTSGFIIKDLKLKNALKIGLFFGFFQFIMPILGWLAGINFSKYIEAFDHWIAFFLLGSIGVKMIYEALRKKKKNDSDDNYKIYKDPLNNKLLLVLAIATSIDALAVGVSLAAFGQDVLAILSAGLIIGIITFVISFAGVFLGKKFGSLFQKQAEIAGGVILILIGVKIFVEHLTV
jgi:putative Mn2+ efflux pump MntP